MLEKIMCYLQDLTKASNYFQTVIPLARLITDGAGKQRPAQYIGGGQVPDITIFDNVSGLAYFRLNGKQRVRFTDNNQVPCYDELQLDFPIRLVGAVQKSKLSKDDAFAEERMTRSLISQLTIKHSSLTKDLKATSVTFIPTDVTMDGNIIVGEEYKGQGLKDINYNYAYIAIDFIASVQIKINCIESEC